MAKSARRAGELGLALSLILCSGMLARAQVAPRSAITVAPAYSNFFELARPYLTTTVFGGAYRSDKYATTEQGFQLDQTVTKYVGVVGRFAGYQLYEGSGFDNPLNPGTGHQARLNLGRLQGGLDLAPYPGTHLFLLGGGDVGDSHAGVVEGDFSSWLRRYSPHPLNVSFSSVYNSENGVTSTEIDLRTVVISRGKYMALAGAGGAIYAGGFVPGVQGEGGPAVGGFLRSWNAGFDLQSGYGSAGAYVELSVYKVFGLYE